MQWLVRDARPNDSLFFHCASRALPAFPSPSSPPADPPALARRADSGHGGQQRATEGDEADGMDENIYPLDHKTAGTIVDNDMHRIMVTPLPQGCRLTAIFDCVRPGPSPPSCACMTSSVPSLTPTPSSLRPQCHSGSALDLPYTYSTKGVLKEPNMLADAGSGALGAATSYLRGDMGGVFKSLTSVGKRIMNGDKATEVTKQTRSSAADVITLSGSRDDQTSADANIGGQVRRPRRCGPSPLIEEALWGLSDLRELPRPSHDVHKVLTPSLTLCAGDRSDVVEPDLVLDQVPSCVVCSLLGLLLSPLSPASAPSFPSSTCARHVLTLILLRWCRANLAVRPPLLLPLPRRPRTTRTDSLSLPAARSQLLNTIRDEIKKYEQKPQLAWCVSLPLLAPPLQLDEAELTLLDHCPAARTRWTSTSSPPSESCLPHEASRYAPTSGSSSPGRPRRRRPPSSSALLVPSLPPVLFLSVPLLELVVRFLSVSIPLDCEESPPGSTALRTRKSFARTSRSLSTGVCYCRSSYLEKSMSYSGKAASASQTSCSALPRRLARSRPTSGSFVDLALARNSSFAPSTTRHCRVWLLTLHPWPPLPTRRLRCVVSPLLRLISPLRPRGGSRCEQSREWQR